MKCTLVLLVFALMLTGCARSQVLSLDVLAADPVRLHALRGQCRRGEHNDAFCAQVAKADLQRFFSGRTGPGEYRTFADLPPIPPSFDGPVARDEAQP